MAEGTNEKGDLLTRLAGDLFFALGYDNPRFDTHKPGREIDVQATHRHEPRDLIAECKSGKTPIGGADINKFIGVLDMERRKRPGRSVNGYFVSLGGFTATALTQEEEAGGDRLALLDGRAVTEEIVRSGIVVSAASAVASAYTVVTDESLEVEEEPDLIAHEIGWIWAVYFTVEKVRSAAVLIHADGTPLSTNLANRISTTAVKVRDSLTTLTLLNSLPARRATGTKARNGYLKYLTQDFGGITLEGLPADQHVGSKQFRLENLYVPLTLSEIRPEPNRRPAKVNYKIQGETDELVDGEMPDLPHSEMSLGRTIKTCRHLAILGPPGSGKTTSLKRLAVAYADPSRRQESADELPDETWFPILIRCRHLLESVRQPILQLILDQVDRAEFPEARKEFSTLATEELRKGNVLLLIDGLDEIASSGDRAAFVSQLRTFIATYPTCRVVLTSREVGFRSVAAAVNTVCTCFRVNGLPDGGIRTLVDYWHRVAVGIGPSISAQAKELSRAIIDTNRVRILASNPLLLTTLLLVQRWIGQLPRRRTVLYQKAIEVLLMTWNAEGHEPLDPEEALPQLAYVAFSMMENGRSSITLDELAGLLTSARRDLPELLSYARMSVHKFLDRVEERSSLMTISGHEVVDGTLKPTYEFKHLTFQEYLAALAISNSWLPCNLRDQTPLEVISTRLNATPWMEVVNLTAVLSGRHAPEIVIRLKEICVAHIADMSTKGKRKEQIATDSPAYTNLKSCIRDEVAIKPTLATDIISFCITNRTSFFSTKQDLSEDLHGGRYDTLLRDLCYKDFVTLSPDSLPFGSAMSRLASLDVIHEADRLEVSVDSILVQQLGSDDTRAAAFSAAGLMGLTFQAATMKDVQDTRRRTVPSLHKSINLLVEQVIEDPERTPLTLMRLWALSWALASQPALDVVVVNKLQRRLLEIWRKVRNPSFVRFSSWAFSLTPIVGEWTMSQDERSQLLAFADREDRARDDNRSFRRHGAIILRYYVDLPARSSLARRVREISETSEVYNPPWRRDNLIALEEALMVANAES